jgi:hypothetical protein
VPADPAHPAIVPAAELAVARAIARRSGRAVFGVVDGPGAARRLTAEPPDDVTTVAYLVEPRGPVRWGPAGRPEPRAGVLVADAATIAEAERRLVRDAALSAGATVFACAVEGEPGPSLRFAPPADGSLRYAVRPDGTVLVGEAAATERPRRVADPGWPARTGAALRALRRLAERGAELAELPVVTAREWARLERLVPEAERRGALAAARVVGRPGREAAALVAAAVARAQDALRATARDALLEE